MNRKHLVFLELNRGVSGVEYLKAVQELNYEKTLITFDPAYYKKLEHILGISLLSVFDNILTMDTHHNLEILFNRVHDFYNYKPFDGIFPSYDLEIHQASIIAEQLGLPGPNPNAVRISRNKLLMREQLNKMNIPTPKFIVVSSQEELSSAATHIGFPSIVKPIDGQGSEEVKLVHNQNELEESLKWHLDNPIYWRGVVKNPCLLVEEYMKGPLLSVETVSYNNKIHVLGITSRILTMEPFFAELGGDFPVQYERNSIIETVESALKAIDYNYGPAHTEVILTEEGPRIVEINPRIAGATISLLINASKEKSIHKEILKIYVGDEGDFTEINNGYGMYRKFIPNKNGIISSISGLEDASKEKGVIDITVDRKVGEKVSKEIKENGDVLGCITVIGTDENDAKSKLTQALTTIQVQVEDDSNNILEVQI